MRILIADDDFTSRTVLAGVLKKEGHEVEATVNGAEVWQALQQPGAPALIASREALAHQATHDPLTIAMTAAAMAEDRERCLQAGMDGYLSKPVRAEQLREMLGKYWE
jgi:CheY-like chemotaxis protein